MQKAYQVIQFCCCDSFTHDSMVSFDKVQILVYRMRYELARSEIIKPDISEEHSLKQDKEDRSSGR